VGKDALQSEYWFFKDDCQRLFIRREQKVPVEELAGASARDPEGEAK
jgi:hypothetical protein